MPINVVVNGFFRSGTTFIWSYLKESLEKHISLYEPLNPDLALLLNREKQGITNSLHDKYVFKDYLDLKEDLLNQILRNHPNTGGRGLGSDLEIFNYLDLINSIEGNVFIQPNRLHFYLDAINDRYTNNIVHIIRNPLDVYSSINKAAYALVENELKQFLHQILKPLMLSRSFELKQSFDWIISKYGYPANYKDTISSRLFSRFNTFEIFVLVWTISNFFALKSCVEKNLLFVPYEFIVQNPLGFKEKIADYLEHPEMKMPEVKFKNRIKKYEGRFKNCIKKLQIEKEYKYIIELIHNKYGITYE